MNRETDGDARIRAHRASRRVRQEIRSQFSIANRDDGDSVSSQFDDQMKKSMRRAELERMRR